MMTPWTPPGARSPRALALLWTIVWVTALVLVSAPSSARPARSTSVRVRQRPLPLALPAPVSQHGARVPGVTASRPVTVCAPFTFGAFGLRWNQSSSDAVTARVRSGMGRGALGPPFRLEEDPAEGPDWHSREWHGRARTTELVWVGRARCVEVSLRSRGGLDVVRPRVVFIDSSGEVADPGARGSATLSASRPGS